MKTHCLVVFLFWFGSLFCQEEPKEKMTVLPQGAVHQGDFFATEANIELSGEVQGDCYLFGQQVVINGTVKGDVLVFGGTVDFSGDIEGNLRAVGGQILILGNVGRNVTVVGGNVQLLNPAKISGNFLCMAGNCDLAASIGNNAKVFSSNLRLSGKIANNVIAHSGDLRVTSSAAIGGNLQYSSDAIAFIEPTAEIKGQITHHRSALKNLLKGQGLEGFYFFSKIAGILMNFLFSFASGFILIRYYPKKLHSILATFNAHPLKVFATGLMVIVVLPLIALLLLVTILGAPFALALFGFFVIFSYAAKTIPILAVSNKLLTKIKLKPNTLSIFTVGLVIYFLIIRIPYIGIFIILASLLGGLGATALARSRKKL